MVETVTLKNRFESLCSRYYVDKNDKDLLNQIKEILASTSQSKKICLNECISDKISACNSKNDIGILYIYCRCYLLNFFFFLEIHKNISFQQQFQRYSPNSIGTLLIPIKFLCFSIKTSTYQ